MNNESKDTLTIAITGVLTIGRGELEQLMRQSSVPVPAPAPAPPQEQKVDRLPKEGKLPRLAFSVKETAEILGVAKPTIYRLLQRGLLRSSLALRCKVIAKAEIERFLKETSRDDY